MDEKLNGPLKSDVRIKKPSRFGRIAAGFLALGASDPVLAAGPGDEGSRGEAALAAFPPGASGDRTNKESPKRKYRLDSFFKSVIDADAKEFWDAIRRGGYREQELADDILLYAAKKSPRRFWDYLLASNTPGERLMQDAFIESAISGAGGVESFFSIVDKERITALVSQDRLERFTVRAAEIDPETSTLFLRYYYEKDEVPGHATRVDLILKGIQGWRDAHLRPGRSESAEPPDKMPYEKMVGVLNNLYVLPAVRDDLIEDLSPATIYRIATSAPDEIFTSSYKKALAPLLHRHAREKGLWKYLQTVDPSNTRLKTFFGLASTYNELSYFLKDSENEDVKSIGEFLVAALEVSAEIPDAVLLLEFAIAASKEPRFREATQAVERRIIDSYKAAAPGDDLRNAFGVIGSIYAGARRDPLPLREELEGLQRNYRIPNLSRLDTRELFDDATKSGVMQHRQRWYFADSLDGRSTLAYTISQFKKEGGWVIEEHRAKGYIVARKRVQNRMATVYMNSPNALGVTSGDAALNKILRGMRVHLIATRGHSFEEDDILKRIAKSGLRNPSIFDFGSCGSQKAIEQAWSLSDESAKIAVPISSRGTTDKVNNHKILSGIIRESLRDGKIDFPESWQQWKINPDYIPPYENYTAAAIYMLKQLNSPKSPASRRAI